MTYLWTPADILPISLAGACPAGVLSKPQSYALWRAGRFGTRLRSWAVDEWREANLPCLVALRYCGEGAAKFCYYDLLPEEVPGLVAELLRSGYQESEIVVCEVAPREKTILSAEYWNGPVLCTDGYPRQGYLLYSTEREHMREALASSPRVAVGMRALAIVEQHLTPSSFDDFRLVLDEYPGHVVKVSAYDECLGDVPHRNALVWEVRRY